MTADERTALIVALPAMTDREVLRGMETAELESEEFDLFAGEAERRQIES